VGGVHAMNQAAMTLHGNAGKETTVMLDGIQLNSMCGNSSTHKLPPCPPCRPRLWQGGGDTAILPVK